LTKTYTNILCMFWSLWRQINSKLKRKKVANTYNQTSSTVQCCVSSCILLCSISIL
jgi:hypothetical protein